MRDKGRTGGGALRRALAVAMLAVSAVALAACQGGLTDPQRRTAGEFVDDASILTQIKTRLIADPDVRGLRINVDVKRGVVGVTGRVRSDAERRRVLEIVDGTPNVARVIDKLLVAQ